MNICKQCEYHLKMSSLYNIGFSIDLGTWNPFYGWEHVLYRFHWLSFKEPYKDLIKKDMINWGNSHRYRSTKQHSCSNRSYDF